MKEGRVSCGNRRNWTAFAVLDEIGKLHEYSPKQVQRECPKLYGAAIRYFGSWGGAVRAAGIDYELSGRRRSPRSWDAERVLEEIRMLEKRNSGAVRREHKALYSAALRCFRSWREAVERAGFDYGLIQRGWIAIDSGRMRFWRNRA